MNDMDRYLKALHGVQTAVKVRMLYEQKQYSDPDTHATSPKHLRTGVNSAMVNNQAVARLLIDKGIFTVEEYNKAMADCMEEELASHEKLLRDLGAISHNMSLG